VTIASESTLSFLEAAYNVATSGGASGTAEALREIAQGVDAGNVNPEDLAGYGQELVNSLLGDLGTGVTVDVTVHREPSFSFGGFSIPGPVEQPRRWFD
jgi:hypothetical protein